MNENPQDSPFNLFLRVARAINPPNEVGSLQMVTPFLIGASWASKTLPSALIPTFRPVDLVALVGSVTAGLDPNAQLRPDRVLAFILTNWEVVGTDSIEAVTSRLSERFPEARCEVFPLHVEGPNIQIILAAGST